MILTKEERESFEKLIEDTEKALENAKRFL